MSTHRPDRRPRASGRTTGSDRGERKRRPGLDLASSGWMSDLEPWGDQTPTPVDALALAVGCEFQFEAPQSVAAVVQVAPSSQPGVVMLREQWDTRCDHHGYIDLYGNRCERFTIDCGSSRIGYEAELRLSDPADVIEPDAPETPVGSLPDAALSFVMPSRFCLPDELGNEAWQRFGELAPGWGRVQAIVDFV